MRKNIFCFLSKNKFIIFNRNNIDVESILNKETLKDYKDNFLILDNISIPNVSSSAYRETLDKGIVLNDVHEYVIKNKLYKR